MNTLNYKKKNTVHSETFTGYNTCIIVQNIIIYIENTHNIQQHALH